MEDIVDIHCHPTFRTFIAAAEKGRKNPWKKTFNTEFDTPIGRWAKIQSQDVTKESQSNFSQQASGGVGVVIDSLYPVEKGFLNIRKVPKMVMGPGKVDQLLMTVMGIEPKMLNRLRENMDYFPELLQQYALLAQGQGLSPDNSHSYQLARDFDHLKRIRTESPNTIAVVTSIEGAHALGAGTSAYAGLSHKAHQELLSENIRTVKSWESPPLFVNLCHHFWNQLAGHCKSIKPPTHNLLNQSVGMHTGFTDLGWHVTEELLNSGNGRRVLIDTKHMSLRTRKEYYEFVGRYNRINPHDKIPIICSHTGVNGFETMEDSVQKQDNGTKMKNGGYFHTWSINVSNEEIRIIHESGGLIGIMLDKGLLSGISTLAKIKNIQEPVLRSEAFLEMVWKNIFQIVKAVGNPTGWDTVSIGSDFDGVISHLDPYPSSASMAKLKVDLAEYLEKREYNINLWYGLSPKEIVRKVFGSNAMRFLAKHFRDRDTGWKNQETGILSQVPGKKGIWVPHSDQASPYQA